MGFTEILTLIFVFLKVFGAVSWSWLIVLSPEIVALVIYLLFLLATVLGIRRAGKHMKKHFDDLW